MLYSLSLSFSFPSSVAPLCYFKGYFHADVLSCWKRYETIAAKPSTAGNPISFPGSQAPQFCKKPTVSLGHLEKLCSSVTSVKTRRQSLPGLLQSAR